MQNMPVDEIGMPEIVMDIQVKIITNYGLQLYTT